MQVQASVAENRICADGAGENYGFRGFRGWFWTGLQDLLEGRGKLRMARILLGATESHR